MQGEVYDSLGNWGTWKLIKLNRINPKLSKSETQFNTKNNKHSTILYPNMAYGLSETPRQKSILFQNATVWTNESMGIVDSCDVAIEKGKIIAVGRNLNTRIFKSPKDVEIIDASNKHITSGIIDEHSHIAISKGVNEGTQAVTSEVRIGDAINADDINIYRQLAGGVTIAQLLHGSANPIGGQSAIIKLRWGKMAEDLKYKKAKPFIKFALGENVKQSNWGSRYRTRFPQTRMGVEQIINDAFVRAQEYSENQKKHNTNKRLPKPRKDLELDALVEILNKTRFITCHSYIQSEILMLMELANKFDFQINTFTHILEGYKITDELKAHGASASTFSDWWAYKYEVNDAIPYNATLLADAGVNTAINSDDAEMGRRLNQEAAKMIKYGDSSQEEAWKSITLNPAKMLKIDQHVGSLKKNKDADIVVWSSNPLSMYSMVEQTYIDGRCYFSLEEDRKHRASIKKEKASLLNKLLKGQK
jgi:imidazolonepropionase-like amidohydrolase